MEAWQVVTTVSVAIGAAVALGSATVAIVKHPFAKFRREIGAVRTEGREAHEKIGTNIDALGTRLEGLIRTSSERLEGKIDKLSVDLTEVQKGVAHIDGAMPHIEARLGNLENRLPYIEPRRD